MRLHTTNSENNKPIPRSKNNQGRTRTLENDPQVIYDAIIFALVHHAFDCKSNLEAIGMLMDRVTIHKTRYLCMNPSILVIS